MKKHLRNLRKAFVALAASVLCVLSPQPSHAQATTQVMPRQYQLFSGVTLSNTQVLLSNPALPTTGLGYTNVGAFTNTFMPFTGAHAIGLQVQIVTTNKNAAVSNIVVTVFPAYDVGGGNSAGLAGRYGTNFSATPLLVWTIPYITNGTASTNLMISQWEPATSLGYIVSNAATPTVAGASSNVLFWLTQTVTP